MNVSRDDLYRLIVEEYVREEGLDESKVDDLIAHIKGGPRPDWMDDDGREIPPPPDVSPTDIHGAETQAFPPPDDIPSDDAPESEYSGFQNDSTPDVEEQLSALIQGMEPEAVAELFQSVFEKIPGVEMGAAEEEPESLYSPGAGGRPVAGFQLENLMELIREVLEEGDYHDMGGKGEVYSVLDDYASDPDPDRLHDDPELAGDLKAKYYEMLETSPDEIPDDILIWMMEIEGFGKMIVLDGDGDLANREEVIVALKNV
jgi:hypothetical protein